MYQAFSEVAKQKAFITAAKVLNVTPSAISHSINGLEKELGFALFFRNRNGVQLTSAGEKILPIVREILNTEDKLLEEAARINGLDQGRLRIGAFSSVCINWLPDMINTFKQEYPEIEISVWQGDFNEVIQQIKLGELDIGFSALPIKENLEVLPLYRDEIYCVAPEGFEPRDKKAVVAADVADKTFILQEIDYDRNTKAALDAYDVPANSLQYSIDDASIIAMVESGLGLGILPDLALQKLSGNVVRYPFSKRHFRTIALVTHSKAQQTPSTRAFIEIVTAYLTERYGKLSDQV
ncbi:LysR family transcriptional regulator [Ligilactobacillus apodemi DSM 16634 = JCM 16172]|uniref:LysR family transcriptional regulator n=2 Tax=Ligilactobacillus TaxID=2767887 RepID=A0A0R1TQ55_9LACO|nr:LysR family transcriptional regulator [Ligilactobacillus apodemi DSM 16634 = JCM 16172]